MEIGYDHQSYTLIMGMTVSIQVNYLVMDLVGLFPVVGIYTVWRELWHSENLVKLTIDKKIVKFSPSKYLHIYSTLKIKVSCE